MIDDRDVDEAAPCGLPSVMFDVKPGFPDVDEAALCELPSVMFDVELGFPDVEAMAICWKDMLISDADMIDGQTLEDLKASC
jgi:hypothetical protein